MTQLCCFIVVIVVVIVIRGRMFKNEKKKCLSRAYCTIKRETYRASIYAYQSIKLKLKQLLRHGKR